MPLPYRHELHNNLDEDEEAVRTRRSRSMQECDMSLTRRAADEQRWYSPFHAMAAASVDRCQRLAMYYEAFYAAPTPKETQSVNQLSIIPSMLDYDVNTSLVLRVAVDVSTLAYLAQTTGKLEVLYRAQELYGTLLMLLAEAVAQADSGNKVSPTRQRDALLALMLLTSLSQFNNPLRISDKSQHFMIHYTGSRRYLAACGPKCLERGSNIDNSIYMSHYTCSMLFEISDVSNKFSVPFDSQEWSDYDIFEGADANFFHSEKTFLALLKSLPSLIQRAHSHRPGTRSEAADHLLYRLLQARSTLTSFTPDREAEVYINDADHFDFNIEEQCFIYGNPTIDGHYSFPSPDVARDQLSAWMMALIVECAILRTIHTRAEMYHRIFDCENRAHKISVDICKSVWYLSTLSSPAYAKFAVLLVTMAQTVFEQLDLRAMREYGWTQAVLLATETRMGRLKEEGKGTMCAVQELGPGMARRCRWR